MSERAARRSPTAPPLWGAPLAVLGGGLLGSAARWSVTEMVAATPGGLPVATLAVNLLGSLLLGFYLARRQRAVSPRWSLQFWAIGVLGSFTTFSAFSLEVFQLLEDARVVMAGVYVLASIMGGVAAAVLGDRVGSVWR